MPDRPTNDVPVSTASSPASLLPEKGTGDGSVVPSTRGGKVDRVLAQARGLSTDLAEWVNLRVQLTQIEIEERVDRKIAGVEASLNEVASGLFALLFVIVTVLFALVALALALGAWLGHPGWGFLVVTALLALCTLIVWRSQPGFVRLPRMRAGERPVPESGKPPMQSAGKAPSDPDPPSPNLLRKGSDESPVS